MSNIITEHKIRYQSKQPMSTLDIPDSNIDYLYDAYRTCEEYWRTHNPSRKTIYDYMDIHYLVSDIFDMLTAHKWTLNPNNPKVQEMVKRGERIFEIFRYMKNCHRSRINYIPQPDEELFFPKLISTCVCMSGYGPVASDKEYDEYCRIIKSDISFDAYFIDDSTQDIFVTARNYKKAIQLLFDIVNTHTRMITMIDIYHKGYITKTLLNIRMFMIDVITAYHWCFIRRINTSSTDFRANMKYNFSQIQGYIYKQIKKCIMIISLYSNEDNIDETLSPEDLDRYQTEVRTARNLSARYRSIIRIVKPTNAVIPTNTMPILDEALTFRGNDWNAIAIRRICKTQTKYEYRTIGELFRKISKESYLKFKNNEADTWLDVYDYGKYKDTALYCGKDIITLPKVALKKSTEKTDRYNKKTVSYESQLERPLPKKLSSPAPIRNANVTFDSNTSCSAMYDPHKICGDYMELRIPVSLESMIYTPNLAEMYLDGNISTVVLYPKKNNILRYNEPDRSHWKPRRNNWNQ